MQTYNKYWICSSDGAQFIVNTQYNLKSSFKVTQQNIESDIQYAIDYWLIPSRLQQKTNNIVENIFLEHQKLQKIELIQVYCPECNYISVAPIQQIQKMNKINSEQKPLDYLSLNEPEKKGRFHWHEYCNIDGCCDKIALEIRIGKTYYHWFLVILGPAIIVISLGFLLNELFPLFSEMITFFLIIFIIFAGIICGGIFLYEVYYRFMYGD